MSRGAASAGVSFGSPALITGVGLVTPLGTSLAQTWDSLLAGRFVNDHSRAQTPAGESSDELPTVSRLAVAAAREAVVSAQWESSTVEGERVALVVGTSKGPIEQWIAPPAPAPPATSDKPVDRGFGLHDVAGAVAGALRLPAGPRLTLSAACASGLHALIRGTMMLRCREADRVLIVAAEASVHPMFVGSFRRLGVLPREGHGCRPYDRSRAGFLMSEAAAAVCLESAETPRAIARVDRFAFGGDAFHLTGVDPEGRLLRRLLSRVIDGRSVDLVHGHGTGTQLNDPVELSALDDLIGDSAELYSHKGALGHSLGASGLVSVALNCKAAMSCMVPGNVRTNDPLPSRRIRMRPSPTSMGIGRSLAIAAGFGGATAAVSLCHDRR